MTKVTNIVVAGLGGQGVLKGTDILADVALRAGYDVKKSEIKGMSQRGGSVTGDVRFGEQVFSPMVPAGEADFLLVLEPTQVEPHRYMLRPGGILITPDAVPRGPVAEQEDAERGAARRVERAPADGRRAMARLRCAPALRRPSSMGTGRRS